MPNTQFICLQRCMKTFINTELYLISLVNSSTLTNNNDSKINYIDNSNNKENRIYREEFTRKKV